MFVGFNLIKLRERSFGNILQRLAGGIGQQMKMDSVLQNVGRCAERPIVTALWGGWG